MLIRGVMFISYPIGGLSDGTQNIYRFMLGELLEGNLSFGNLRSPPGYPLFIAPVVAIGELFGRFNERVILFFQLALASTIPFMLYDILRTRHSPKAAFFVALLSLADPFGLQWAHFSLPVWLVVTCLVFSLWLLHHAQLRRSWALVVAAGLVAGLGVLGRWNFAPIALGLSTLAYFIPAESVSRRLRYPILLATSAFLLVSVVFVTVQQSATGGVEYQLHQRRKYAGNGDGSRVFVTG